MTLYKNMENFDEIYFDLINRIFKEGQVRSNRTGVDSISLFGPQIEFKIDRRFPLLLTKKVWMKGIIHELLWFISGSTNIQYLVNNNVHIWDKWAYEYYKQKIYNELGRTE